MICKRENEWNLMLQDIHCAGDGDTLNKCCKRDDFGAKEIEEQKKYMPISTFKQIRFFFATTQHCFLCTKIQRLLIWFSFTLPKEKYFDVEILLFFLRKGPSTANFLVVTKTRKTAIC